MAMSDSLAGASFGLGLLSAGASIFQQEAQQKILNQNAGVLRQNAGLARASGQENARMIRMGKDQAIGTQRATWGASGLSMESASLLDVQANTSVQYELDAQKAIYNSELQARGLEYAATMQQYQGRVQKQSTQIGAGLTVLASGVNSVNSVYRGRTTYPISNGVTPNSDVNQVNPLE